MARPIILAWVRSTGWSNWAEHVAVVSQGVHSGHRQFPRRLWILFCTLQHLILQGKGEEVFCLLIYSPGTLTQTHTLKHTETHSLIHTHSFSHRHIHTCVHTYVPKYLYIKRLCQTHCTGKMILDSEGFNLQKCSPCQFIKIYTTARC